MNWQEKQRSIQITQDLQNMDTHPQQIEEQALDPKTEK